MGDPCEPYQQQHDNNRYRLCSAHVLILSIAGQSRHSLIPKGSTGLTPVRPPDSPPTDKKPPSIWRLGCLLTKNLR